MKKFLSIAAVLAFAALTSVAQSTTTTTTTTTSKTSSKQLEPFRPRVIVGVNNTFEFSTRYQSSAMLSGSTHIKPFNAAPFLSVEAQLSRHSGLELDLGYRYVTYEHTGGLVGGPVSTIPNTSINYFSAGVMYKFYSRILNFSTGITMDLVCGKSGSRVSDNMDTRFGFLLRVTKDIRLYKGLMIEPYAQFNPFFTHTEYCSVGVGIGIKYAFTCGRNK